MTADLTILGIDPGSQVTGFGVIVVAGKGFRYVASGCIRTRGGELADRLRIIYEGATRLVEEYRPDEVCVERVFVNRNVDSALKLGHARAAALCGTFLHAVPVHEYAAREIKLAVTGSGAAEKGPLASDAADALAVAICHAQLRDGRALRAALAGGRK